MVAQKRHKTRLFPVIEGSGIGKNQNVKPGTVVDHDITHPTEFSFFLASHEGIQVRTIEIVSINTNSDKRMCVIDMSF